MGAVILIAIFLALSGVLLFLGIKHFSKDIQRNYEHNELSIDAPIHAALEALCLKAASVHENEDQYSASELVREHKEIKASLIRIGYEVKRRKSNDLTSRSESTCPAEV